MIENIKAAHRCDGYKTGHVFQYPKNTQYINSNFTPRKSRVDGVDKVLFVGMQYFILEHLIDSWNKTFFNLPFDEVISAYKRRMRNYVADLDTTHIEKLHKLGYLPIRIKALPEGTLCPIGVPVFTITNTNPDFGWLPNYLETMISNIMWKPITSATTAYQYRKNFEEAAKITGYSKDMVKWQGHDFSYRGMSPFEDALVSGFGHLCCFTGTDTIPSIDFCELFYGADSDKELIGGTIPATEHSVMCLNAEYSDTARPDEYNSIKRLLEEVYPSGFFSMVSDSFDFWKVLTYYLKIFKVKIMEREGRLVVRPDSGDPIKIICGDPDSEIEHIRKGAYECLWDIFGGTTNEKDFKFLDSHIGLIYGDAISLQKQKIILDKLIEKGFAPSNLVLGIGSYTYQYVTRDTYGFAMKATWGVVDGVEKEIFKDPLTDRGFKKSARGLLMVYRDENGEIKLKDRCTKEEEATGLLEVVFEDGKLMKTTTLAEIRNRVDSYFN